MDVNQNKDTNNFNEIDEIDIRFFINFLLRNKKIISFTSIIFFLLSIFLSLVVKKVWVGQFEIVLDNEKKDLGLGSLGGVVGVKNDKNIKTEVGILESPSILMPIFEYVKLEKLKKNPNLKTKNFDAWKKNNLNVKLKKNTSILKISYSDNNKKIIIPVLEKMSFAYQNYSNKNEIRNNQLTKIFLTSQIEKYKEKSSKSFKDAQEFSIDQDLDSLGLFFNQLPNNNDISTNNLNNENIDIIENIAIEKARVKAANRLREIDSQIKKIENLDDDADQIQYIGSNIPAFVQEGLLNLLKEVDEKLMDNRLKYSERDPSIKILLDKREELIKLIRKKTIAYFKADRLSTESVLESVMRPKQVLINYKELLREAKRDEATLVSLENQLRLLEVDAAKLQDPWQLITNPTLLESHKYPSKIRFGFVGILIGLIFGILFSIFKEKKSDLVYDKKILENYLEIPVIENINIFETKNIANKIIYLKNYILFEKSKNISFIPIGKVKKTSLELIRDLIVNAKTKTKNEVSFLIEEKLSDSSLSTNKFLFANLSNLKFSDISDLRNYIKLLDLKIKGIILLGE